VSEGALAAAAVDVESVTCGVLMMCRLEPGGDTDAFTFTVPADRGTVSIKVAEVDKFSGGWTFWGLFGPTGQFITSSFGQAESGPLARAGTHTIIVSNGRNAIGDYTLSLQKIGGP
jgi:hypothetical protein